MPVQASTPIDLVRGVYGTLTDRVAIGRRRLGRSLTLAEKILINHLDDPESKRFPFFDDMRGEGVTDYVALPLFFTDGTTHASSWCTRAEGGFTDEQYGKIYAAIRDFLAKNHLPVQN